MRIHRRKHASARRGTATVELAVCLPAIVFVTMAAIQASDTLFLKQTLHVSAYETIRVAIQHHSTTGQAEAAGQTILDDRNVTGTSILCDPLDVSTADPGDSITVTVTAPCEGNTVLPSWLYGGQTIRAATTMVKE